MDEHCRITVVGERHKADLAVPADAPITAYISTLVRMCGQGRDDVMPPAWSLAAATCAPFAPERTLNELGIVDGAVLYLRNVIEGEYADPVVHDVGERVAEVAQRSLHRRWDARARTGTALAIGLGWLVAALIVLAVRRQVGRVPLGEIAVIAGLALPMVAWTAGERGWPIPSRLREAVALSAVPILALGGWTVAEAPSFTRLDSGPHPTLTAGGLTAAALVLGALVGAVAAYGAAPSVTTCAVLLAAILAGVLGIGLALAEAGLVASAAAVAVLAFALLTVTPVTAGRIVAFCDRRARARGASDEEDDDSVAGAVLAAATLLVVWSGALALVLGAALVFMAASRSPFATAAAACLGLGLLVRAGAARLTAEVVPLLLAGGAGLATLLLIGPGHLGWPDWIAPTGALVIGAGLVGYGLRRLMRRPDLPAAARPRWMSGFGSILGGTGAALAVAAFGVFGRMVELGHHI